MTEADANGQAWQISTSKNHRGEVTCCATQGTLRDGSFSYALFGGNKIQGLAFEAGNATEARIQRVHEAGLAKFTEQQADKPAPYVIEVGQILGGVGRRGARAVCKIEGPGSYKTVYMDGHGFGHDSHLTESDYVQGEKVSEETLADLVRIATAKEKVREDERIAEENERIRRADAGKAWFQANTPSWARAIVVAQFEKNTSDVMTDYFASTTERTILLAWSPSERDTFDEMRRAAKNCPETASLADLPENCENRHKHSMGAGYWLGEHRYSGWQIRKLRVGKDFYLTCAADPANICIRETQAPAQSEQEPINGVTCKLNAERSGIELYFPGKPSAAVLTDLKANGFRWAKYNKCWYKHDSTEARRIVAKYAQIPGDNIDVKRWTDPAEMAENKAEADFERTSALVTAQENAYLDGQEDIVIGIGG